MGQRLLVSQPVPQLLRDVRGQGGDHQHQRFHRGPGHHLEGGQDGVVLREPCDGGVERQPLVVFGDGVDGFVQGMEGVVVDIGITGDQIARLLVDDVAPQPLQESLRPDHGAGLPRLRLGQRAHTHFVEAEGVSAVGLVHLVRGDDVLQRLAHLPVLAFDRLALPGPGRFLALPVCLRLGGGHGLAAGIAVGVGLDVALIEQAAERLGG